MIETETKDRKDQPYMVDRHGEPYPASAYMSDKPFDVNHPVAESAVPPKEPGVFKQHKLGSVVEKEFPDPRDIY